MVAQKEIADVHGLEGRTFAISAPGAVSYHAPRIVLEREGVDVDSINYLAVGNDKDRARALIAGTVDAAVINEIETPVALAESDNLHVIYEVGSAIRDDFLATAVCATDDTIRDNAEAVQRAVDALIESARALESDTDAAIEFAVSMGLDRSAAESAIPLVLGADEPYWGVNGGITQAAVDNTVALLIEQDSLQATIPYADLVAPTFVEQAIEEVGEFE
jgi:ABC-type nitrate/sulfonate/bicarbonate transport system substrate-binding protein